MTWMVDSIPNHIEGFVWPWFLKVEINISLLIQLEVFWPARTNKVVTDLYFLHSIKGYSLFFVVNFYIFSLRYFIFHLKSSRLYMLVCWDYMILAVYSLHWQNEMNQERQKNENENLKMRKNINVWIKS